MPCRDKWEGLKPITFQISGDRQLRVRETRLVALLSPCWVCQSKWPRKLRLTVSQSTYLNPSTHRPPPPPPLQSPIYNHLILSPIHIGRLHFRRFFFFKGKKKHTHTKRNVSTQDTKTPNCFCKTWIAWYRFFFLVVVLIWQVFFFSRRRRRRKKIHFVFNSIFKLRDVVLLPFYKVCSL